ncbi:hypothetical protein C8R47DRAFT_1199955 [Mycena vitilis]|nr:hypothetical protein C8R47DRAFT_1199955 [Mycena vitilis]
MCFGFCRGIATHKIQLKIEPPLLARESSVVLIFCLAFKATQDETQDNFYPRSPASSPRSIISYVVPRATIKISHVLIDSDTGGSGKALLECRVKYSRTHEERAKNPSTPHGLSQISNRRRPGRAKFEVVSVEGEESEVWCGNRGIRYGVRLSNDHLEVKLRWTQWGRYGEVSERGKCIQAAVFTKEHKILGEKIEIEGMESSGNAGYEGENGLRESGRPRSYFYGE